MFRRIWVIAGLSFTIWGWWGFQASGVSDDAVTGDQHVRVTATEWGLDFRSLANPRQAGIVFLPGAMVDPVAYAPLLKRIARAGYPARLAYLPMRCAFTNSQVRQLFGNIHRVLSAEPGTAWILAGHSRGGMLAARFAHENRAAIAGLVLIGTTHPRDFSLADLTLPVMKVYATRDGVAGYDKIRRNRHLLPPGTNWVRIEGGNHVQFGYYRHQLGDGAAAIPREKQQELLEAALLNALSSVNRGGARIGRVVGLTELESVTSTVSR